MITIPQHGNKGELYDFNQFLEHIEELQAIVHWRIRIEECLGEGSVSIEDETYPKCRVFSAMDLRARYKDIYQTIDGEFVGLDGEGEVCRLIAVDSSYWEVSGSAALEKLMSDRYGAYRRGA